MANGVAFTWQQPPAPYPERDLPDAGRFGIGFHKTPGVNLGVLEDHLFVWLCVKELDLRGLGVYRIRLGYQSLGCDQLPGWKRGITFG